MAELTYWPKRALFCFLAFSFRIVLAAVFWRKKKSVPPVRNRLLMISANQLAKEIRERKLKSEEVIKTYINRIMEVEPYINAVVQDNFDRAIDEARKVDALIESRKFSVEYLIKEMPFLGVPFTVKCILKVKGFRDTASSLIFKDRIADCDAPEVTLLKKAGGIFIALTNSPEFGSSLETVNNLFGKTSNPYDTTKTCGGSSGGEAALISAAGSIMGLGNDLLGSLRIPSHFCGVFAHKPSRNLISSEGNYVVLPPLLDNIYSAGPISRFSGDLFTIMKVLLKDKKEINFQNEVDFRNLKIYYQTRIENAWVFDTDREIVEAVHKAVDYFKNKYGTKVKEIKIPHLNKINTIVLNSYNSRIPSIIECASGGRVKAVNGIVELIKMLFGKCQFTFSTIIPCLLGKLPLFYSKDSVSQGDSLNKELENEFDRLLDKNSLFIFPTWPTTAPYHREGFVHVPCFCYTSAFNILGLPVTQCPMGFNKYGLPLGIQIVGQKLNDSLTLLTAVELEKYFGGWTPP